MPFTYPPARRADVVDDYHGTRVLLDPNQLSEDGAVAIIVTSLSDDGAHLAYSVAESGSDWQVIRVRDTTTGNDLPDELRS